MRSRSLWILLLLIAPSVAGQSTPGTSGSVIPPVIDPRSNEPIDLVYEDPTSITDIYRALSRAWGIDFVLDPKLRDQEISFVQRNVAPQVGLANLLRAVSHFYIVVDPQTILIADDTPQNRRTYEHQVIQRFFLENTEVKDMMTMIRSLIGAKHVAANTSGNSIVLRDTADKVQVAEQIFARNDRPKAEVIVDVDLLAIDSRELQRLKLRPAARAPEAEAGTVPARLRAGELARIRSQASTRALAQPRLNIVVGSHGKLRLTDRLPLPARFADARAEHGGEVVYQEVGLGLQIEPWVHSAEEVSLRLDIVVDALTDWLGSPEDDLRPVFGRRSVESSLRLRDGETYLITGLMLAPALPEVPQGSFYFGRFLDHAGDEREVILALTPHVVRGPGTGDDALAPLWVGTESNVSILGSSRRTASPRPGPFDPAPGHGAEN